MVRKEPQLVFFTIFTQLSVGLVVVWGLAAALSRSQDSFFVGGFIRLVLAVVLLFLVTGVLAASFHLRRPGRSLLALANIQHSWLSRETLTGLVFGALVTFLLLLLWNDDHWSAFAWILVVASSLAGLSLVGVISRLYMIRTVPAWNHPGTPATFFTTSLLLGTASLQVLCAWFYRQGWPRYFDWVLIGLVSLQCLISLSNLGLLSKRGDQTVESLRVVWSKFLPLLIARWMLAFGSVGLLFVHSDEGASFGINPFGMALLVFILLLGSEVIGRWLFYGSYRREGI